MSTTRTGWKCLKCKRFMACFGRDPNKSRYPCHCGSRKWRRVS